MSRNKKEKKFLEQGVLNEMAMVAYLNNELDAEERQQFEKLLKDDPFAQEALEGLQSAQNKIAVSESLSAINKKVRTRIGLKEKKTFQIHWTNYSWAAVLVGLLIGIGFVMINYIGNQNTQVAEADKKSAETNLFEEQKPEQKLEQGANGFAADSAVTLTLTDTTASGATNFFGGTAPATGNTSEGKQTLNSSDVEGKKGKEEAVQLPFSSTYTVTATSGNPATSPSYMNSTIVADDAGTAPAKSTKVENMKIEKKNNKIDNTQQQGYMKSTESQNVVRGSIVEKEEKDKTIVISLDEAMRNFNSGDYKTSANQFEEILRHQPNNADALYFGGISDYINGNNKKSEKNFDKLLKEGTKFLEGSKWYKANILLQKGKNEEAKKLLDELSQTSGSYKERAIKKKADLEF